MPLSTITNPFLDPAGSARSNVYSPSANTIGIVTAGTERVRVDSSGNIGVGTSSPGCKLEVTGLIRATSLTNPTSGSGIEVGYDGTQGVIQAFSNRVTNTSVPINIQGDLKMNSGYGSSATAYGCRAWVNFNGTGTVAIRASGNVSSITDNGTGQYFINFASALTDANYSVTGIGGHVVGVVALFATVREGTRTTSGVEVDFFTVSSTYHDTNDVNVAVFR